MTKNYKQYSPAEQMVSQELIRRGHLRHILHDTQKKFYDAVYNTPGQYEFFLYSTRKLGKSFLLGILGVEHCLQRPHAIVRHVFPQLNTAKETMEVILETEILPLLPPELRPTPKKATNKWVFPNGSQFILGGAKPENISSNRGPYCTMLLADELCFWHAATFDECLYGTLLAQTSLIPDARLIYASTPPEQISHPSVTHVMPKLIQQQAFMRFTVYDNPLMTSELIDKQMKLAGGSQSVAWRREYMAELLADDNRRIIPSFTEDHISDTELLGVNELGEEMQYVGLVAADYGLVDGTGILGCRYDPFSGTLHVEHEVFEKGEGLRWLDNELTEMWDKLPNLALDRKVEVVDMFEQAGVELRKEYGRGFQRPRKDKVESQVALVINAFETGRLMVHPRCKILIKMLEVGLWKETATSKSFERTDELLHLDLIAALCYAVKACPWKYQVKRSSERHKALNIFGRKK